MHTQDTYTQQTDMLVHTHTHTYAQHIHTCHSITEYPELERSHKEPQVLQEVTAGSSLPLLIPRLLCGHQGHITNSQQFSGGFGLGTFVLGLSLGPQHSSCHFLLHPWSLWNKPCHRHVVAHFERGPAPAALQPPPPPAHTHTAPVGAHLPPHNNPNAQQHEARATFAAALRSNVSPCVEFRECLQACSTAEPQTLVCVCPTSAQPGGTLPPQPHVRSYALQTAPKPALKDTPKAHRNGAGFQKHYSRAPRCSPAEATHTARGRAEPRRFPAALAGQLEFISGYF